MYYRLDFSDLCHKVLSDGVTCFSSIVLIDVTDKNIQRDGINCRKIM